MAAQSKIPLAFRTLSFRAGDDSEVKSTYALAENWVGFPARMVAHGHL